MGGGRPVAVRIVGLLAVCADLRADLARLAGCGDSDPWGGAADELVDRFRRHARQAEEICRRAGLACGDLPAPSRRARSWIEFLGDGDALAAHLAALRAASLAARRLTPPGEVALRVDFFHTATLWRVSPLSGGGAQLIASEAFITAPQPVIEALVGLALQSRRPRQRKATHGLRRRTAPPDPVRRCRALVRDYAASPAFVRVLRGLESGTSETRGRHYDLEEVFLRVNAASFGGRVGRPFLTWNRAVTRRKLGHYQPGTDTVMLSLTLDSATVPAFVVDFVMYHELLHKHLGVGMKNGRQRAHTAAFRRAEKAFPRYEEAQAFLKRIGKGRAL